MDLGLYEDEIELPEEPVDELDFIAGHEDRDYQRECQEKTEAGWKDFQRQLVVMATGTGKGNVLGKLAAKWAKRGQRVLILTHSDELVDQLCERVALYTGTEPDREKGQEYASAQAMVVVASVATIARHQRLTGFSHNHFGLIIIDEAHHVMSKSWSRVVNYFHYGPASLDEKWVPPEEGQPVTTYAKLWGCTATPDRGDRKNLGSIFQHVAFEYDLLKACRDGWLVRPVVENIPLKIDIKGIRARGKDLDAGEVAERLNPLLEAIGAQIAEHAWNRKTIVFMPSIDSSKRLAEAMRASGLNAKHVYGNDPEREEKIAWHKAAGVGSVLVNASVLLEGYDDPSVDCICILRPTKIRSLFVQAVGRGTRVLKGILEGCKTRDERLTAIANSSKKEIRILDFLWLTDRLDLIKPTDLVASRIEIRELMDKAAAEKPSELMDLLTLEAGANRDLLQSLAKAAKAHARKAARTLDPLKWAVSLGDLNLAQYEPQTAWERQAITPGQKEFLSRQQFDVSQITTKGHASEVIGRLMKRYKEHLASPFQLTLLNSLGLPPDRAATLTDKEASAAIDMIKKEKAEKRAAGLG